MGKELQILEWTPDYTYQDFRFSLIIVSYCKKAIEWAENNGYIKIEKQTGGMLYCKNPYRTLN